MRLKVLAGLATAGALALGAFAATGFGKDGDGQRGGAVTVATHGTASPPAAAALGKRGGGLDILYRESDAQQIGVGYTTITVKKCPDNSGVVDGWLLRSGADKSGVLGSGGPDGVRKWTVLADNLTGNPTNVKVGLICLK